MCDQWFGLCRSKNLPWVISYRFAQTSNFHWRAAICLRKPACTNQLVQIIGAYKSTLITVQQLLDCWTINIVSNKFSNVAKHLNIRLRSVWPLINTALFFWFSVTCTFRPALHFKGKCRDEGIHWPVRPLTVKATGVEKKRGVARLADEYVVLSICQFGTVSCWRRGIIHRCLASWHWPLVADLSCVAQRERPVDSYSSRYSYLS